MPMKLFAGRMNRSTFLLVVLTLVLVAITLRRPEFEDYLGAHEMIGTLVAAGSTVLLLWLFAAGARRLHDINMSGWFALLLVIPGMQLFLLLMPGTKGKNKYGTQPTQTLDVSALLNDKNTTSEG
jgi:uncharacterized membrane protein YhaH (DUF805 family)